MTAVGTGRARGIGLSGATLKYIAVITMLIDHIGAAFFIIFTSYYDGTQAFAGADRIYTCLRAIGRTAFPIFCFLLVEGFIHTHNLRRYLGRMLLFVLLSEIPFDLALSGKVFSPGNQNVFFTLLLGLLMLTACRWADTRQYAVFIKLAALVLASGAAYLLRTDYDMAGVILIFVLYQLRDRRTLACITGYICMCWELWCFPAFILAYFYNGEKGRSNKYFFYIFYPVHLLVLYGVRMLVLHVM